MGSGRTDRDPHRGKISTCIGGRGSEPIVDSPGALVKRLAFSARMAAQLAVIEDQRQRIGKKSDDGEHEQCRGLMNGGMFEVAVVGDGLKYFRVDSPAAATELMNEQRRDRAEFEIGRVSLRGRRLENVLVAPIRFGNVFSALVDDSFDAFIPSGLMSPRAACSL